MAVVAMINDGCILDHNQAIASGYRACTVPNSSLPILLEKHRKESQDLHETCASASGCQRHTSHCNDVSQRLLSNITSSPKVDKNIYTAQQCADSIDGHQAKENCVHNTEYHIQCTGAINQDDTLKCDSIPGSEFRTWDTVAITQIGASSLADGVISAEIGTIGSDPGPGCMPETFCHDTIEKAAAGGVRRDLLGSNLNLNQSENSCRHMNSGCDRHEDTNVICENSKLLYQSFKSAGYDLLQNSKPEKSITAQIMFNTVLLNLKHGFFLVNLPFMMDSQFEKVIRNFAQASGDSSTSDKKIQVADIQQMLRCNKRKRKAERNTTSSEEERLLSVHSKLKDLAREQGIFLEHIPQPLDNNLLSRQCSKLDNQSDVFTDLLVAEDGRPLLHKEDCKEPLFVNVYGCARFSAAELIHRKVCHMDTEACIVDIDGTNYVLPACSNFILSNLEDFCDHLYLELNEVAYDLIVLDPPWENKSVKRKKSYHMMNEDGLENLPMSRLARPGCLLALWVTNNERLEDYSLNTLFPLWGFRAVGKWHWVKVTQTGDLICDMEGHKRPYEVLLLGRALDSSGTLTEEMKPIPEYNVMMSVPCSLHSKKPPLAEILQPYLSANPRCLELFARNMWPGWTSWGREVLKHQSLLFYDVFANPS